MKTGNVDIPDDAFNPEKGWVRLDVHDRTVAKLTEQLRICKEALEEMHNHLVGRQHEQHVSLMSNPMQNGCLVYSEWKLKSIKEKALAKVAALEKEG